MSYYKTIHDYVEAQIANMNRDIDVHGWPWNFKNHVKTTFFYKHGRLLNGNDENTPVKNTTRPLLNLQYRAEDIDVKDIIIYVDDPNSYHLSFLVKKYHDNVFVVNNDLDTFLDETKEEKIDYGASIIKKIKGARPEIMPLQSIAFCDQTNFLSAPIGFLHNYSIDELQEKAEVGWGSKENGATATIDELITLAEESKKQAQVDGVNNQSTGRYLEIYEIHGNLPKAFLDDSLDYNKYIYQLQIVGFYKNKNNERKSVILFRKKQNKGNLKVVLRDKIVDRCTGFGGGEELFEPHVWTNYFEIRKKDLLDASSKTVFKTTDPAIRQKHPTGLKGVDNLEFIELTEGTDASQLDTTPKGMALFNEAINSWEEFAQRTSGASEALLGNTPPSGTPFKLQDLVVQEGKSLHNYRRGKFAKFIEEVYRDWIIPYIIDEIVKGTEFLSELSMDEMQFVANSLVANETEKLFKEKTLSGQVISQQELQIFQQKVRDDFLKGGNKKFIKILKDEFKKKPLRVKINVAGKQKDFASMVDKLVNIFRQIISNPQGFQQMMQIPEMAKNFNMILEYSGLSPVNFAGMTNMISPIQIQGSAPQLEGKSLAGNNNNNEGNPQ